MSVGPCKSISRDVHLDFLRGVALFVVLIDHIEDIGNARVFSLWTPISTGFSDGAEAFVFLSGVVFESVYSRRLKEQGYLVVQRRLLVRSMTLWLTFLLVTAISVSVAAFFESSSPTLNRMLDLSEGIPSAWFWSVPMCFQPYGLSILAFYAVLMPFAATMLWLQSRHGWLAWILSVGLYLGARNLNWLELPRFPWGREWFFNPFAWQFLFFLGIASSHLQIRTLKSPLPQVLALIVAVAVLAMSFRVRAWQGEWPPEFTLLNPAVLEWLGGWREKTRLHPVRILHFLCLAYLIKGMLPDTAAGFWRSAWVTPVVKMGQQSLLVYAFGVALLYLSAPVLDAFRGLYGLTVLVTFDCCILSIGFAYFVALAKTFRKRMKPPLKQVA